MMELVDKHSGESRTSHTSAKSLRALATRYQKCLEKERTRLAQELHDNLTQKLTVVSLELSLLDGTLFPEQALTKDKFHLKIKELGQVVNDMIQSLRKIKAELRPKVLDEFGVIAAMEWESDAFAKRTGLQCFFKSPETEPVVVPHVGTELFRMFQELLSNAAVHAHARRVEVHVTQENNLLVIKVADDGKGISRAAAESAHSLGLLELRERAYALNGHFEIHGMPGRGTTAMIKVPMQSS